MSPWPSEDRGFWQGQDAQYTVDGVAGSSSSNTVTDAIPGVTLTLGGVTTTSGAATINVTAPTVNTTNVVNAVQKFVTDYNKGLIAPDVLKDVDDLKAKLLNGTIVVPNYFDLKPGQKEMGTPPMATPPSLANATTLVQ